MARMEIVTGRERRRRWSDEKKLQILHEAATSGLSVADVARRYDVVPQQIYIWRRQLLASWRAVAWQASKFLSVSEHGVRFATDAGLSPGAARKSRIASLLEMVGLGPDHMIGFPHEFSGGRRQRIGSARALVVEPKVIVAEEPVSALDVSVKAQVLNLMQDLRRRLGLAMLFISHDLDVVELMRDRIAANPVVK